MVGKFSYSGVIRISLSPAEMPSIHPNPAIDNFTVTGQDNKPAFINVVDTRGGLMLQRNVNTAATAVDIAVFHAGTTWYRQYKTAKLLFTSLKKNKEQENEM